MSGAYPLTFRPARVRLRSWSPGFVSVPHSLKTQRRSRGAHRWVPTLVYGPCTRDEYSPILAFLDEQRGQFETFSLVLPGAETPRGAVSGAPLVDGAHAKGAMTVNLKALGASVTNVFRARDFLKFAGHAKVYEVTRDASSNGSGQATVYLHCPLAAALANDEAVAYAGIAMTVRHARDDLDYEWKGGLVCPGFEVQLIEEP